MNNELNTTERNTYFCAHEDDYDDDDDDDRGQKNATKAKINLIDKFIAEPILSLMIITV